MTKERQKMKQFSSTYDTLDPSPAHYTVTVENEKVIHSVVNQTD